jgi:hypothetical protein
MPIGAVWARSLPDELIGFSLFETQQLLVDVREQFLLDGLTEDLVVKGIDRHTSFHQQQVPPSPLYLSTEIRVVGACRHGHHSFHRAYPPIQVQSLQRGRIRRLLLRWLRLPTLLQRGHIFAVR